MSQDRHTSAIISAQNISAQNISAQNRTVEVLAGDIDATIAIMDTLAEFCATDPAAGRFVRLFAQRIHPFEIATLAEGLVVTFTQRLTTPAAPRAEL